ncbi:MAG: RluA family pseudouridine synthase, partial [Lachnospiraceae bacterium]|nr:RluA family pseudouridine synthase [Lachnospiraceae bacterium]
MKEIIIDGEEAGIRLDKFLEKLLPHAGRSFLYKMLRKKNITLNGKKAEGSERLCVQDKICIFFSDETYAQFRSGGQPEKERDASETQPSAVQISVLYEARDMLLAAKPAG